MKSTTDRGKTTIQPEPKAKRGGRRSALFCFRRKQRRLLRGGRIRRGAAVVEFAVIAPILFLLVFGMVEYGRLVMVQQVLTNATREGARKGVLDGTTTNEVQTTVTNYLDSANINGATVTVTPNPPDSAGFGDPVTVSVTIPFDQVSWLPAPMFLSGVDMTATSVMRREATQ